MSRKNKIFLTKEPVLKSNVVSVYYYLCVGEFVVKNN